MYIGGFHSVMAVLKHRLQHVQMIYVSTGLEAAKLSELQSLASPRGVPIVAVKDVQLKAWAGPVNHQGVVVLMSASQKMSIESLLLELDQRSTPPCIVILDQVQDPQNLGSCLRLAAAFGCDAIIIPKRRAAALNATVAKVASGAQALVPIVEVTNIARTIKQLQQHGFWVYATTEHAKQPLMSADVKIAHAWVLGNEAQGVRSLVLSACDQVYAIPVQSEFSTLNVAMSMGVCLYETARARMSGQTNSV